MCFKYNEVGHFSSRCPNKYRDDQKDRNYQKYYKYMKIKYYKEKGKKSRQIVEEEHTESNSEDEKNEVEVVYVSIKEDPNEETCEEGKGLISHLSKNDT